MTTKHNNVSIETKIEALQEVNKAVKSKAMIAKGYDVPASTLSTWIKNKDSILKTETCASTRKRIRTAKHTDVETALLMWFKDVRSKNFPFSGPNLQKKVADLAKGLGVENSRKQTHVTDFFMSILLYFIIICTRR